MMIIIDAQLSPHLALWITDTFGIACYSAKFLGLHEAEDQSIFEYARNANAVVMTKDEDFVQMFHRFGSPPRTIWIACGNTSNQSMRQLLSEKLQKALELLQEHNLVEISN